MKISRRKALALLGTAVHALALRNSFAQTADSGIKLTAGAFRNTRNSLTSYSIPEWFADAKFGIW